MNSRSKVDKHHCQGTPNSRSDLVDFGHWYSSGSMEENILTVIHEAGNQMCYAHIKGIGLLIWRHYRMNRRQKFQIAYHWWALLPFRLAKIPLESQLETGLALRSTSKTLVKRGYLLSDPSNIETRMHDGAYLRKQIGARVHRRRPLFSNLNAKSRASVG
ncbi:hypothetical protein BJ165DRAFT_1564095 [Panaeolus papilionaceus]|nr:hypothetical protein BJ165DRAFT_1564095 [Panaeolus papilionaceus]